ncbi:MAG: YwaF family protein [Clostridia bacterium]|nr:YwaF family protein [Clostridia bacterium]
MNFFYLLTGLGTGAFSFATLFAVKKFYSKYSEKAEKIFSVLFYAIFFVRYLGSDLIIMNTIGLNIRSPFGTDGQAVTALAMILTWLDLTAFTALLTYPFFKNKIRSLSSVIRFFATPVYLVCIFSIGLLIKASDGQTAAETLSFKGVIYAVETGFALGLCVYYQIEKFRVSLRGKDIAAFIGVIAMMIAASVPTFALQVLFGYSEAGLKIMDLTFAHRLIIYFSVVLPFIIFFLFRRYDLNVRRYALLYLSLAAMHSFCYCYTFDTFRQVTSWPLHLCNTAMFIIPLCLMFKLDGLFYFTLFINVFGAMIAMLMPNYAKEANVLSYEVVNFYINHYCAFFMPILMVALRIYERPKFRQFTYSIIAFGAYFLLVLILNAWFSNYGTVDFFFINSDYVAKELGQWAKDILRVVLEFDIGGLHFKFYPLYQFLFFLVYVLLSFAMWFLYEQGFQIADVYYEVGARTKKIKADKLALEVSLAGRSAEEPMELQNTDKLILKNFSKKYATSDVYAVENANLEISGGQIFGFLGPNGAGKSTIIKSIVGIQTITSGSIEVCGYDVEKQPVGAKLQTGFVPDHYALYENLTGREYVNYIADLYGVSKEDRTARIDEYVRNFNLERSFDNQIKTYSHGMKQKITIMSALVHNPKLWILDEPLTGLDPESIFQVKECMKKHAQAGNIVFFSSHIIDVVERICDRIAIIKGGHILCERSVKEIEESGEQLEKFYMETIGELRQ